MDRQEGSCTKKCKGGLSRSMYRGYGHMSKKALAFREFIERHGCNAFVADRKNLKEYVCFSDGSERATVKAAFVAKAGVDCVPALLTGLKDREVEVRQGAAFFLRHLGNSVPESAIAALHAALFESDVFSHRKGVRRPAYEAQNAVLFALVGCCSTPQLMDILTEVLFRHDSDRIRWNAIDELRSIKERSPEMTEAVLAVFARYVTEDSKAIGTDGIALFRALSRFDSGGLALLVDHFWDYGLISGRGSLTAIIALWPGAGPLRRINIMNIIKQILLVPAGYLRRYVEETGATISTLSEAIGDPDVNVRRAAVSAMASARDPVLLTPIEPVLMQATSDPDAEVVRIATEALSKWAKLKETPFLSLLLQGELTDLPGIPEQSSFGPVFLDVAQSSAGRTSARVPEPPAELVEITRKALVQILAAPHRQRGDFRRHLRILGRFAETGSLRASGGGEHRGPTRDLRDLEKRLGCGPLTESYMSKRGQRQVRLSAVAKIIVEWLSQHPELLDKTSSSRD
jgi:hypothetical protein